MGIQLMSNFELVERHRVDERLGSAAHAWCARGGQLEKAFHLTPGRVISHSDGGIDDQLPFIGRPQISNFLAQDTELGMVTISFLRVCSSVVSIDVLCTRARKSPTRIMSPTRNWSI